MQLTRFTRLAGTAAAAVLALSTLGLTPAYAAAVSLHNPGTEACTSGTTSFHFVLAGVQPANGVTASQSASVQFQQASGGQIYTVSLSPDAVHQHEVSYTVTRAQLMSMLGISAQVAANLVVTGGSVSLPSGVTVNNFNVSGCPLPTNPGTTIPEVPVALIYPALGGLTLAGGYALRRLRRRPALPAAI